jgi:Spy/CpxP family protein refolding chaperone
MNHTSKFGWMIVAGVLMTGIAVAQDPAGSGAPSGGRGPGAGFGDRRPPFERSMGEHGHFWNDPKVAERLKLTDAQRKSMDDTLQQHRETLVDLRGTLQKAELELEPMMKEDQPNENQILAQIDKVAQARAELEKANARFLLAVRSKLTPEQWKQLQAERANRPHHDWRNGQGSRPGGEGQGAPPPGGPQSMLGGGPAMPPPPSNFDSLD